MSRIVVVTPWAPPSDGIARYSANIARDWLDEGHEVIVLAPPTAASGEGELDGQVTLRRDLRRGVAFRPLLAELAPDHIVVQFAVPALRWSAWMIRRILRAAEELQIPVTVAYHEASRDVGRLGVVGRRLYRGLAAQSARAVAFVPREAQVLESVGFTDVQLVPHGTRRRDAVPGELVRERYGLSEAFVMSFGYVHPHKSFETFIDALALMDQPVTALLAGSVRRRHGLFRLLGRVDEKYDALLAQRIAALPASVRLVRVGYLPDDDLRGLLQSADAVVIPYVETSQSGVAAEVLANSCVVVAAEVPGLTDMLHDAATYVPPRDPAALARALTELRASPAARAAARERAARWAEEESFAKTAAAFITAR
jgi:glycosyltransferase involved in cell wall biosynthesis